MHYIVNLTRHSPDSLMKEIFKRSLVHVVLKIKNMEAKKSNIEASKVKQKIQNHHHGYAFSHFEDNFLMRVVY